MGFRRIRRAPLQLPMNVVNTVIAYVGDGFEMSPMTAALATALQTPQSMWHEMELQITTHWNVAQQRKLIINAKDELDRWWNKEGGRLISEVVKKRRPMT